MYRLLFTFFFLFTAPCIFAQTYITHVTLLDVVHQKTVPDQTIVIANGIISSVQLSKKITVPAGAEVIDGKGKFIMPGLTDAHVHFFQSGGLYTRPDGIDLRAAKPYPDEIKWVHNNMEDFLRRYVQAGVTSVFDVGSTISFLKQRDSFAAKMYAPHIFMTGPLLTSYEPAVFKNLGNDEPFTLITTTEEGIKGVQAQLSFHPDFIKVWYIVKPDSVEASAKNFLPIFKAIVAEAHKNHLPVAVHATEKITARLAVENGCDYLVHQVEDEVVDNDFIQLLKAKHVILCPTLIVADGYSKTFGQNNIYSRYELDRANPGQLGSIDDVKHLPASYNLGRIKTYMRSDAAVKRNAKQDSVRMINLKKMADAGVIIAAGTDAGNVGTQHASSLYTEMLMMKASGLSNWQVLQSATINATGILHNSDSLGSISAGKKADMILLNTNPADSLSALENISVVINKGVAIYPGTLIKATPLSLVMQQLNAYNQGNLEAFLAPYADSVKLYNFPNTLLASGKDAMRKQYAAMFASMHDIHCEIKQRIIQGNVVIDKEYVTGIGKNPLEAICVYTIENDKIATVYFKQ